RTVTFGPFRQRSAGRADGPRRSGNVRAFPSAPGWWRGRGARGVFGPFRQRSGCPALNRSPGGLREGEAVGGRNEPGETENIKENKNLQRAFHWVEKTRKEESFEDCQH
ncbi:hypothetical protein chiPu_0023957, partial [Chiloscyllium punctatum]|nr:hypothetical protein [Chiloscyllium punctatum]